MAYFASVEMWQVVYALLVILAGVLLKNLFARGILVLLRRITRKTNNPIDEQLIGVMESPLRLVIVLISVEVASQIMPFPPQMDVLITKVLKSLALFAVFWVLHRIAHRMSTFFQERALSNEKKLDDMLVSFLSNGAKVVVYLVGGITIAQVWFNQFAGILTGLGLGGLAFALAAQDTAKNLFGSITILMDRPFSIGDWIQTPSLEGTVEEIGFRSTKVRTFPQAIVTIPNGILSNEAITNWSRMGKRRISFRLGLHPDTTKEQLKILLDRLRSMLETHPQVHPETNLVCFERFGENKLEVLLYFFTVTTAYQDYLAVQEDINFQIMGILEELHLYLALPTRSISIEGAKAESTTEKEKSVFK